jgi:hypothetical protein
MRSVNDTVPSLPPVKHAQPMMTLPRCTREVEKNKMSFKGVSEICKGFVERRCKDKGKHSV